MGSMSITHWLIVLAVVLLVFGTGKISGLMGDFAKGIKAFKKGLQDEDDDDHKGSPPGQQKIDSAASQQAHEKEKERANVG